MFPLNAWVLLVMAGLLEVCWTIGLKYSDGFNKIFPSIFTVITLIGSMYLLSRAIQTLPIGTAYGVWVGIGTIGAAIFGIVFLNEAVSPSRIFFLILLLIAIIGLKLTTK